MAAKTNRRRRVTLLHRLEYIGWRLITGLLKLIPRRGIILFADGAGWLLYHGLRVRRDVIDTQLRDSLGRDFSKTELEVIGRQCWQNAVLTFFEFIQPEPVGSKGWDAFTSREGYEKYGVPLLQSGKTGIIITAHIGNWEALATMARREGVPVAAVAKPMHNDLVNDEILKSRARRGLEVMQIKASMKGIVDALRKGKWVAMLGDQDARRRGIFVDFFGRPASTAPGVAHLAYLLDIPLVPAFCVRQRDKNRSVNVIFTSPIYPDKSKDREADIHRMTQEHTTALETVIRRHPADYFWLHRRWKTQPKVNKTG